MRFNASPQVRKYPVNKREKSFGLIKDIRCNSADESLAPKAPEKIIGDTGCSMHLIGKAQLLPEHRESIIPDKVKGLTLPTAMLTLPGRLMSRATR